MQPIADALVLGLRFSLNHIEHGYVQIDVLPILICLIFHIYSCNVTKGLGLPVEHDLKLTKDGIVPSVAIVKLSYKKLVKLCLYFDTCCFTGLYI